MDNLYKVYVPCLLTGNMETMHLPVSQEEVDEWREDPHAPHVQDAFPQLNPDEREFILNGITPEIWTGLFGEDDSDLYY